MTFPAQKLKCKSGADLGGGGGPGGPATPPTPNFEAQIFAAAAILLCDVGKISLAPPPYTNPGSAPGKLPWRMKMNLLKGNLSLVTPLIGKFLDLVVQL